MSLERIGWTKYIKPMSTFRKVGQGLLNVLFWSVIAAAFVGPGTVTTAATAGAGYGYQLIWALGFAIVACIVLQEAAARIPLGSGLNLGQAIARRYARQPWLPSLAAGAIICGGMAYQAGNILGAVSGLSLMLEVDVSLLTTLITLLAAGLLWWGREAGLARLLGIVVAIMGIVFVWVAIRSPQAWGLVGKGLVRPSIPEGSIFTVLALVGTTIVPYNLFLGSGISRRQPLRQMRWGIAIAVFIGGIISLAILLAGTQVSGPFTFPALATRLVQVLGSWAAAFFATGLFAAGFTSAITAPLASALTAQSIWGKGSRAWHSDGRNFRIVWGLVLLTGWMFGVSGIQPIPVIILAQALNGLLLPFLSLIMLRMVNDRSLLSPPYLNRLLPNLLMLLVAGITCLIGLLGVIKAWDRVGGTSWSQFPATLWVLGTLTLGWVIWEGFKTLQPNKE